MDYKMLEDNLADVILEAQLKLGYEGRSMSMNYPLQSLNRLLGTSEDGEGMKRLLDGFADFAQERLGRVEYSRHDGDIFRLCVPEKGVEYIHGLSGSASSGFLAELIAQVKQPEPPWSRCWRYSAGTPTGCMSRIPTVGSRQTCLF